jgi:excisionase family DNA binding protein
MTEQERQRREDQRRATVSVPEAAKILGVGRNQGYEAVKNGQIPVIRIGKRLLVPMAALDRMLKGTA